MNMLSIRRSSAVRISGLSVLYATILFGSYWAAYLVRFDFNLEQQYINQIWNHGGWLVAVKMASLLAFGQFSGLLSYFSLPDLRRILYALICSTAVLVIIKLGVMHSGDSADTTVKAIGYGFNPPRGVLLMDFIFSFVSLSAVRLGFRVIREKNMSAETRIHRRARRVGIIGAGDVGASLARDLISKRGLGLQPVAFFDDDENKWHSHVHNIPVVGNAEALLDPKLNLRLEEVIIAMPTAAAKRIGEIVKILQTSRLRFETVPSMDQLATGKVRVSQLRAVEIQDLLGREPVELETENISHVLTGKVVMVTGAGGSIGSELCRQIAAFNPQRLLLIEQSEVQIFQVEQDLIEKGFGGVILPLVADILDPDRMRYIFKRFSPQIIFHAAAHKHVPMMESQPSEAIKNNTLGTVALAELALEYRVDRFTLISTDKAINPTNVMGASKRLSEIFLQSLYATRPESTKFMAVRFGNVLGSSGSVIPTFNKQIAAGGPVKVTHPDVTRYFMTIPEAAGLVMQSCAQGEGGEIFVLDMGSPIKIVDLARQMIELSGFRPDEDIEIDFIGLRPGEKLFEELSHRGENITPTNHPKILRFVSEPLPLKHVREILEELSRELYSAEPGKLKQLLKKAVPEYQPYLT